MAEIAAGLLYPDRSLPCSRIKLNDCLSIDFSPLELIAPHHLSTVLHRPRTAREDRPNGSHVSPTPFRPSIRRPTKLTHLPRPSGQSTFLGRYSSTRYKRATPFIAGQHPSSRRTRYTRPTPLKTPPARVHLKSDFRRIFSTDGYDASGPTSFLGTTECATTYTGERGTEETGRDGWVLEYGTFPYAIRMDRTGVVFRDRIQEIEEDAQDPSICGRKIERSVVFVKFVCQSSIGGRG